MNKQPFYHAAELKGNKKAIIKVIGSIKTVIKDTIEYYNNELLFTATSDVSNFANNQLQDIPGISIMVPVGAEPGDPADLI